MNLYVPLKSKEILKHRKGINLLIPPAVVLILPLLSFYKYYFGIKKATKVDMPLDKEIKPNLAIKIAA